MHSVLGAHNPPYFRTMQQDNDPKHTDKATQVVLLLNSVLLWIGVSDLTCVSLTDETKGKTAPKMSNKSVWLQSESRRRRL